MLPNKQIFSNSNRQLRLGLAESSKYDLIVIGGGVTGAGILLDASLRGLKTLLIEKNDFASGTSSKSTKLIHGGLRYLKQFEFGLVKESGLERAIVHDMACHLVHPEHMVLPIVKNGTFGKLSASLAISLYDLLAKVKGDQKRKTISKQQLIEQVPVLKKERLKSGIVYSEYRTDDARLTIELIKAAKRLGAEAFNYLEVDQFEYGNEKIKGVHCIDRTNNQKQTFISDIVISASGPWVDQLRLKDNPNTETNLHLSKGVHIVLDKVNLPINNPIYFDAFDGRMIFAIPRGKMVYIGTTDDSYSGDPDKLSCNAEEANYLLGAVNNFFDVKKLEIEDIKSTWSGLRPLIRQKGKAATELSRKDEIFVSDNGLVSIAGGKLTGFRKMAERVVDLVLKRMGKANVSCSTKGYHLHHNPFTSYENFKDWQNQLHLDYDQIDKDDLMQLVNNYGKDAKVILDYAASNTHGDLALAELEYGLNYESIYHPLDFFERRNGWLYFDIDKIEPNSENIITRISEFFELSGEERETFLKDCRQTVRTNRMDKYKGSYIKN